MFLFRTFVMTLLVAGLIAGDSEAVISPAIQKAVADSSRPEEDRARDARRKPDQVLAFFQIAPGQKVADLLGGSGYYTGLLARVVGDKGQVIALNTPFVVNRFPKNLGPDSTWEKRLASPEWHNVLKNVNPLDDPHLPEGLDAAIMVLFYHDTHWQEVDRTKMNQAIFKALKPGGIFGIVDHAAEAGSGARDVETLHRIDQDLVVEELTQAGFVLEASSAILHNPQDGHDYNVFRDFQSNRDNTDRFVLRFRKPK